jgi:GNAT superfamily N-acetyltransferase
MAALTFKQAVPSDAQELAMLRIAAMRDSLERIGRFDPVRARDRFLSGFDPALTMHIEADGIRIGFFVVKPYPGGLLLDHLYIHPDHQGLGVGEAVLRHVFAQADQLGCEVRVGALRGSDSNRFYLRHGFVQVEESEFDIYYLRSAGDR